MTTTSPAAREAAEQVFFELHGRRGFDMYALDEDVQKDILESWATIIDQSLAAEREAAGRMAEAIDKMRACVQYCSDSLDGHECHWCEAIGAMDQAVAAWRGAGK